MLGCDGAHLSFLQLAFRGAHAPSRAAVDASSTAWARHRARFDARRRACAPHSKKLRCTPAFPLVVTPEGSCRMNADNNREIPGRMRLKEGGASANGSRLPMKPGIMDCGGKSDATPLSREVGARRLGLDQACKSGVALRFPPQSKNSASGTPSPTVNAPYRAARSNSGLRRGGWPSIFGE